MIKRKSNGQFAKGSNPIAGFQKGMSGEKSYQWKGGKPKCKTCGRTISYKASFCNQHSLSLERIEKFRKMREGLIGNKHPMWKGKKAGYRAVHRWIQKEFGMPTRCEKCGKGGVGHQMHWANLNHKYRRIRKDWMALCPKCHGSFDSSARKI